MARPGYETGAWQDYYAILGVPSDAPIDVIKRIYHAQSRAWHPDVATPAGASGERLALLNVAWETLRDKRSTYDVEWRAHAAATERPGATGATGSASPRPQSRRPQDTTPGGAQSPRAPTSQGRTRDEVLAQRQQRRAQWQEGRRQQPLWEAAQAEKAAQVERWSKHWWWIPSATLVVPHFLVWYFVLGAPSEGAWHTYGSVVYPVTFWLILPLSIFLANRLRT